MDLRLDGAKKWAAGGAAEAEAERWAAAEAEDERWAAVEAEAEKWAAAEAAAQRWAAADAEAEQLKVGLWWRLRLSKVGCGESRG